jgi:hypothetical protein
MPFRQNIYRDLQASMIRFCRDFGDSYSLGFVNLDAHADASSWPEGDFIGMGEFTVDVSQTDEILVTLAISTKDDMNLLRMSEIVNDLLNQVMPNSCLPLYDSVTGETLGNLFVADGVRVGATLPTETQPLQPIMLRLLSDHVVY